MYNKIRFLLTDTVPPAFIKALEELNIEPVYKAGINYEGVEKEIGEYEGIVIKSGLNVDGNLLDKALRLKYILRPGSGLDNLEIEKAREKNIEIIASPEGNKDAVAEHALGMLLSLMHHIFKAANQVKEFKWLREENRGEELGGKTISVIGFGNTGSAFVKRLSGFNVNVLVHDKYKSGFSNKLVKEATMKEIFKESDVVSLHLPLTSETRKLANRQFFNSFHKQVYFLNTSRGGIVDNSALLDALKEGKVRGAGIDVLENENLESYNAIEKQNFIELWQTGKVLITPHIAGWSKESGEKVFTLLAEKLKIRNEPKALPQAGLKK